MDFLIDYIIETNPAIKTRDEAIAYIIYCNRVVEIVTDES